MFASSFPWRTRWVRLYHLRVWQRVTYTGNSLNITFISGLTISCFHSFYYSFQVPLELYYVWSRFFGPSAFLTWKAQGNANIDRGPGFRTACSRFLPGCLQLPDFRWAGSEDAHRSRRSNTAGLTAVSPCSRTSAAPRASCKRKPYHGGWRKFPWGFRCFHYKFNIWSHALITAKLSQTPSVISKTRKSAGI